MNPRIVRRLFLLLALLLLPSRALAWWDYGHRTVAGIAWHEVRPETRAAISRLLARSALLDTPACPVRTLEEASVWPDCIKDLGDRFSYVFSWHFQNVHVCRPFDAAAACRDGHCVSAQIERQARLLADRDVPVRERVMALAFLAHFVGDLHQPLHAGDRADLGGNRVDASYGIIAGDTNLHMVWDGYLAERGISTPAGHAPGILSELSAAEKAAMRLGGVEDWARESWAASRDFAYGSAYGDPCGPVPAERPVVTEAMTQRLIPVIRRQVARGGLRLARMLDEALLPLPTGERVGERGSRVSFP
jgi:S1/P1 Nuclease